MNTKKPCEANCPKCGSADIYRQHRRPDESWEIPGAYTRSEKRPWASAFLKFEMFARSIVVVCECITHHCRTCQFDWESAPLDESIKTQLKEILVGAGEGKEK